MAKQVMKPRRTARLPQAPAMDPRHKRTWILVADGAHARFFEPSEDMRKLVPTGQPEMTAGEAGVSGGGDARDGFEPSRDENKTQQDFMARVAEVLDKACDDGRFDRIVLVAPAASLGELRPLLSTRVKKTVSHEVGKNLTGSTPTELRELLADALPAAALA
jgi:protein required for attachment to host cells